MMMMLDALSLIAFAAAIALLPLLSSRSPKTSTRLNDDEDNENAERAASSDCKERSNCLVPPAPWTSRDVTTTH